MTKDKFFEKLAALYRVGNAADAGSGAEAREAWTHHTMAGEAFCRKIDEAMREMVKAGVLTEEEAQTWYDTL